MLNITINVTHQIIIITVDYIVMISVVYLKERN